MGLEFLHTYEVYGAGTEALCNVGGDFEEAAVRSCTIGGHDVMTFGAVYYHVSYLEEDGAVARGYLSWKRIMRIL